MRAAAMSLTSTSGFIVILLSVSVVQGRDERVTYTSTQICALKGSTVHMSCTYTTPSNARVDKTFWFTKTDGSFMDLTEDSHYRGRAQYTCDANNCSLIISDLTEGDSAEYKFRIEATPPSENWHGSPGVNLSVTDHPDLQVHVSRPSNCSGDTCVPQLRCQSSCYLPDKYTWFNNGMEIQGETSSLYSTNISSEDKISCAVKGYQMSSSPPVYAPSVPTVSLSSSGEIVDGSSLNMTCNSTANPPVSKYTWYKKRTTDQQHVSAENQLVFKSIQSSDSGEYCCKAENTLRESASKCVRINIESSSTSTIVGVTVVILLLIIVITVVFLFRRKRASKKSAESEVEPQSSERRPPSPKPPKEQDNLHYAAVDFPQNQPNPVYSNTGAARHQKPQNQPIFTEYSAVAFHNQF